MAFVWNNRLPSLRQVRMRILDGPSLCRAYDHPTHLLGLRVVYLLPIYVDVNQKTSEADTCQKVTLVTMSSAARGYNVEIQYSNSRLASSG